MSSPTVIFSKRKCERSWASSTGWRLLALQFGHDPAFHNQIGAETAVQLDCFVDERNRLLPFNPKSQFR
jgi:hypothetical protein